MSLTHLEALLLLMLVTILLVMPRSKLKDGPYCISVIPKRMIGQAKRDPGSIANPTTLGHVTRNELDGHADTCCAGASWTPMIYTGEHCKVFTFLSTYDPVQEVPIARCCTVWTSDEGKEYLLVGDEILWFVNTLADLLINPNQLRAYGLLVKTTLSIQTSLTLTQMRNSSSSIPRGQ